jgi:hypothetical protein
MGFLWDLIQQSQISSTQERHSSLEQRVAMLESELRRTQSVLHTLIERLEERLQSDLDQDGRVGR